MRVTFPEPVFGAVQRLEVAVGVRHVVPLALASVTRESVYSAESDPVRTAPRGPKVAILRKESLENLELDRVLAALEPLTA